MTHLRKTLIRVLPFAAALLAVGATAPGAADALKDQSSAFLRSYADGPVKWMVWGEAAFDRAKSEQKPVFLVVGNFTSELSRAMHRQTFSNPETAAFLNETFVCILVDSKEHRDVTALYQQYLQNVKQLTGLPMNLWLTPELKPFEGANYLPPTEEWGKEGFSTVAKRAAAGWTADPAAQRTKADEAVATVTAAQPSSAPDSLEPEAITQLLAEATDAWRARFDAVNGGFGDPSKYPEPELQRYLLKDSATQEMALTTLRKIVNSALRDPLDGGFFRYAVDAEWKHPYFQKSLADQARMALALLEAAAVSGEAQFSAAAHGALRYALTQLRLPDGDLSAAEDATPESITPTYLWTHDEIRDVLGEASAKEFNAAHGVTTEGNIPADAFLGITTAGKNILHRLEAPASAGLEKSFNAAAEKLLAKRQSRPPALRDDHATSGMHGLLLQALSRASLDSPDSGFSPAAKDEYAFIREKLLLPDGRLRRLGSRSIPAAAEDYIFVIAGLREYHAFSKDVDADELAKSLLTQVNTLFWNEKVGRYFAVGPDTSAAIWSRVFSPTPGPADLPLPEPSLLAALAVQPSADEPSTKLVSALRRSVAEDIYQAAEVARGEQLLALRPTK